MPPLWSQLRSIRSPLLAIAGSRDAKYVDLAERVAGHAHDGRYEIVDAVGHVVHRENLGGVSSIVESFLKECDGHEDHQR